VRTAFLIAGKDLRQRVRDRSAIVMAVIAPVAIAALMSMAFKGSETFHFTLGYVDADHGALSAGLRRALASPGVAEVVKVRPLATAADARAAVVANDVQAALVVPAGFSASITGTRPLSLATLTSADNVTAANVTASVVSSFVAQLNADRLSLATAVAAGAPVSAALDASAAGLTVPEQAVQRPIGAHPLKAVSYYSAGMGIFFLLFLVGYTARSFFVDRSQGMIERMRAAPVRPLEILAGKALSVFVFGAVSLLTVAAITSFAFGADWGGVAPAIAVCMAMVTAVVCATALVIGVARTQRQAEGMSTAIVFGLAVLGGNFVFLSTAPPVMQRLSLLTPNGWAMRAVTDLSTTGGGLHAAALPVLAILLWSAVVGTAAALVGRRAMTAQ
jgi:ABC-2 type transport system permease protein